MAENEVHETKGANIDEAFVADRQAFWNWFTSMTMYGVVAIVVLLAALWFFLIR